VQPPPAATSANASPRRWPPTPRARRPQSLHLPPPQGAAARGTAVATNPVATPRLSRQDGRRHEYAPDKDGRERLLLPSAKPISTRGSRLATKAERPCCKVLAAKVVAATGLATKSGRSWYKGQPTLFQGGCRCCSQWRRRLLTALCQRWPTLLQGAQGFAATGGGGCYRRAEVVASTSEEVVARGWWPCSKGSSWLMGRWWRAVVLPARATMVLVAGGSATSPCRRCCERRRYCCERWWYWGWQLYYERRWRRVSSGDFTATGCSPCKLWGHVDGRVHPSGAIGQTVSAHVDQMDASTGLTPI
jgi:hypothetical protein